MHVHYALWYKYVYTCVKNKETWCDVHTCVSDRRGEKMASRGRPKTAAADHERFTARLPHEVMTQLRSLATEGERAVNTELLRVVRAGLATLHPSVYAPSASLSPYGEES